MTRHLARSAGGRPLVGNGAGFGLRAEVDGVGAVAAAVVR